MHILDFSNIFSTITLMGVASAGQQIRHKWYHIEFVNMYDNVLDYNLLIYENTCSW